MTLRSVVLSAVEKLFLKICDYLFVLRPLILIPAWSFFLLGAGEGSVGNLAGRPSFPSPTPFLTLTAILITAYLLNQIFDRESDRANRKCFFIPEGIFRVRTVLALAVTFFLFASLLFHRVAPSQKPPLILALLLSLVYSLPPLRLCARPFFDLLSNALGYGGIAFLIGYISLNGALGHGIILSTPYALLVGGTFLQTAILDLEGDKETGKTTTAVFMGERSSALLSTLLSGAAVISSLLVWNYRALAITALVFPLSLRVLTKKTKEAASLTVQASTLIVTIGAAAFFPPYLLLVLPLVALSRYYFRKRFGIIYPGMSRGA